MSKKVFISYCREDTKIVHELADLLEKIGVDFFLDNKDIDWGASIIDKVRRGLANSPALIVVLSPASLKSQWVPYEIGYASAFGITILPFLTHSSLDIPLYMEELNYVSSLDDVKRYFSEFGLPLTPEEKDLLEGDGQFEWQWAGQNWHGFVEFIKNDAQRIDVKLDVHKICKTQEVADADTIRRVPKVLKNVEGTSGLASISEGGLTLENLIVEKTEFEIIKMDEAFIIEGFKPSTKSTEILSAKLKRIPAFAGRIVYRNSKTGIESEGDMVLVRYKSTMKI